MSHLAAFAGLGHLPGLCGHVGVLTSCQKHPTASEDAQGLSLFSPPAMPWLSLTSVGATFVCLEITQTHQTGQGSALFSAQKTTSVK